MMNEFSGIGNLGTAPALTVVEVDGEPRQVANMRIYFDRPVGQDFKDKGGFWLTVDCWGYRAEESVRVLKKGTRVFVKGQLRQESWTDDQDELHSEMRLSADHLFIDSVCIENILYRNKNPVSNQQSLQESPEEIA